MHRSELHDFPLADRILIEEIHEWLNTACAIARAGTGTMTDAERAKQEMINELQFLHLSGSESALVPRILDKFRRAGLLKETDT